MLEWIAISHSWDTPDAGMEVVSLASPALAGGFFTPVLTGKPKHCLLSPAGILKCMYTFILVAIVMSSWYADPFSTKTWISFYLKIFLVFKPILTDINVVILALLWVLLHDIYIFHPFASASLYL